MRLFAIFGNPVAHSLSPLLHNAVFTRLGWPDRYIRERLDDGVAIRKCFETFGLSGANITVPFKEEAAQLCDRVEGVAAVVGAVNTIVREGDRLIGYNTDAPGFWASLEGFAPKTALILGAGGTARALAAILKEQGSAVTVLNRSAERLEFFRHLGLAVATWEAFAPSKYELVVNTTSAGLTDQELPAPKAPLRSVLGEATRAYEVIYGRETPFMALAREIDLPVQDGKAMLVWQAVLAQRLFTDPPISNDEMAKLMFNAMELL